MSSLSHTKWNCRYPIVFTPKYRREIFYGQKRMEIGKILRDLCDWNEVKIMRLLLPFNIPIANATIHFNETFCNVYIVAVLVIKNCNRGIKK